MKIHNYTSGDFAWTHWKKADIQHAAKAAIADIAKTSDAIKRIGAGERTFDNTIWPYEQALSRVGGLECKFELLASVHPDKSVRDATNRTAEWMDAKLVDLLYDEKLYRAFSEYSGRKERIAPDAQRLVEHLIRDYRRMGLGLPAVVRNEVKKNKKLITKLCLRFSQRLNDYHDEIRIGQNELQGLPEHYVQRLKQDKRGNYVVTLQYPDLFPFLRHAHSEKRRKELVCKYLRHGGAQNVVLLQKVLRLRERNAHLLGYRTHAHFKLETKMAKTPAGVMQFINSLVSHMKQSARKEVIVLTARKRRDTGDRKAKLQYHDTAFYAEQLRKEKFNLDSEKVREYFPLEFVLAAMFKIYAHLFSVRFRRLHGFALWFPSVDFYEARNKDGSLIGYFGLDLFPRKGKYGHMAAFHSDIGYENGLKNGVYQPPVSFLVGNFPKPGKQTPSLLSHNEVETLFHEFGHIIHFTLGHPRFASQHSSAVARDFVEMPSQMLENWVWDRRILKKISRHYKTGKPLPDEIINNVLAARNFLENYSMMRQMALASYDMLLHLKPPKAAAKINELMQTFNKKLLGIALPKGAMFGAGFGHLMGGYDAGYYGYAWSKVYAADLFTRFEKEGILDARVGKDYRTLLTKAATEDEMSMIVSFLGRRPNNKAFLKQLHKHA